MLLYNRGDKSDYDGWWVRRTSSTRQQDAPAPPAPRALPVLRTTTTTHHPPSRTITTHYHHDCHHRAADYNLKSWSGDQCLPYFKKAEDDYRGNSPEFHGQGGPIAVSDVRYQNPLSKTFLSACAEAGASRFNSDFNDWSIGQEGYGRFSVMERKGERS